jgi:subtilisin-like proprotein convertase family protein
VNLKKGVRYFPFMTLFNWGESPIGKWKLIIEGKDKEDNTPNTGRIEHFSLIFYGTKSVESKNRNKRYFDRNSRAFVPTSNDVKRIYDVELKLKDQTKIVHKRFFEENPEFQNVLKESNRQH